MRKIYVKCHPGDIRRVSALIKDYVGVDIKFESALRYVGTINEIKIVVCDIVGRVKTEEPYVVFNYEGQGMFNKEDAQSICKLLFGEIPTKASDRGESPCEGDCNDCDDMSCQCNRKNYSPDDSDNESSEAVVDSRDLWSKETLPHFDDKGNFLGRTTTFRCRRCGDFSGQPYLHCPNCGAKKEGIDG